MKKMINIRSIERLNHKPELEKAIKRITKLTTVAAFVAGCFVIAGVAHADFDENMSRVVGTSGSGHTVIGECGGGSENWDGATAKISTMQDGGTSKVKVKIKHAKPETLFTVWVRMKGKDQQGNSIGGSPITGGGATPLAPSSALDSLVADWVGSGSPMQPNGFKTNKRGDGHVTLKLDFPLEGGAYPFNNISAASLADAQLKNPAAVARPNAIIDPRQALPVRYF